MMSKSKFITKFGTATINPSGYYRVNSRKEGNKGKLLHVLVWENYYDKTVPKGYDIHHINGIKTDNRIQNLQCVEQGVHRKFHRKAKNTTGFFNVCKKKDKKLRQGFCWNYQYYDKNGKRKNISSVDIEKLEMKVKEKGLQWKKL